MSNSVLSVVWTDLVAVHLLPLLLFLLFSRQRKGVHCDNCNAVAHGDESALRHYQWASPNSP